MRIASNTSAVFPALWEATGCSSRGAVSWVARPFLDTGPATTNRTLGWMVCPV